MSTIGTSYTPVNTAGFSNIENAAPPGAEASETGFDSVDPQDELEITTYEAEFSGGGIATTAKIGGLAIAGVAVGVGLIWGIANTEHVGPQDSGVVYNKVSGEVTNLNERGNIYPFLDYNPMRERVESVPNTPQTIGGQDQRLHGVEIRTADPLDTTADFKVTYRIENPAELIKYYGSVEAADQAIYSAFREVARTESGSFELTDLQGIRTEGQQDGEAQRIRREAVDAFMTSVNNKLTQQIRDSFNDSDATAPVRVVTVDLRDVATPGPVQNERNAAAQARLAQETAASELAAAKTRAETAAAHIEAEANARLAAANTEAERLNTLESAYSGLSPQTIEVMRIEAMKEMAGKGATFIIQQGADSGGVTLTHPVSPTPTQ